MQDLQQRKIWKMLRYSKLAILIYLLLSIYFILEIVKFYDKYVYLSQRKEIVDKQLAQAQDQLDKKNRDLEFLKTPRGQEDYFRKTMPVAAVGEQVIVLYDSTSSPIQIIPTSTSPWTIFKKKFIYFIDTYTNI